MEFKTKKRGSGKRKGSWQKNLQTRVKGIHAHLNGPAREESRQPIQWEEDSHEVHADLEEHAQVLPRAVVELSAEDQRAHDMAPKYPCRKCKKMISMYNKNKHPCP